MTVRCLTTLLFMLCIMNCSLDYASLTTCQGTEECFQGERCEIEAGEVEGICVAVDSAPSTNSNSSDASLSSDILNNEMNSNETDLSNE